MKVTIYPNKYFGSIDEYYDFTLKHHVFGAEAQALKKKMTKQTIPLPRIKNGKKKKD